MWLRVRTQSGDSRTSRPRLPCLFAAGAGSFRSSHWVTGRSSITWRGVGPRLRGRRLARLRAGAGSRLGPARVGPLGHCSGLGTALALPYMVLLILRTSLSYRLLIDQHGRWTSVGPRCCLTTTLLTTDVFAAEGRSAEPRPLCQG